MADLVITAASVSADGAAAIDVGTAGATITAGQSIYKDATDSNKLKLADADTLAASIAAGISLNPASSGQLVRYVKAGTLNLGSGVTPGRVYAVSTTAGGIAAIGDIGIDDYPTVLGVGTSASAIMVGIIPSRVASEDSMKPWIATNTAAGSQLSASGANLIVATTIPGALIGLGTAIRTRGTLRVTVATGAVTGELVWRLGGTAASATDGTAVWASGTFDPATDDDVNWDLEGSCIAAAGNNFFASAGAGVHGVGSGGTPGSPIPTCVPMVDQDLNIGTWTAGSDLVCKLVWIFSTTGNTMQVNTCSLEVLQPDAALTLP